MLALYVKDNKVSAGLLVLSSLQSPASGGCIRIVALLFLALTT